MDIHWAKFWDALKSANLTPEQKQAISAALQVSGLDGKTLRDELAMAATQGMAVTAKRERLLPETIARDAYRIADAMLEARKK